MMRKAQLAAQNRAKDLEHYFQKAGNQLQKEVHRQQMMRHSNTRLRDSPNVYTGNGFWPSASDVKIQPASASPSLMTCC